MKIHPSGAAFQEEGRTDRHTDKHDEASGGLSLFWKRVENWR